MVEVLSFSTPREMRKHVRHSIAHGLHVAQSALGPGDAWIEFADISRRLVRFGKVLTFDEIHDILVEDGATAERIRHTIEAARDSYSMGVLYSRRYDHLHPDGILHTTYAAHVWPIDATLFNSAGVAQWQIDLLNEAGKLAVHEAFESQRAHVRAKAASRRSGGGED